MRHAKKNKRRWTRSHITTVSIGTAFALILVIAFLSHGLDMNPLEFLGRWFGSERQTTVEHGPTIDAGFAAFEAAECGSQTLELEMSIDNSHGEGVVAFFQDLVSEDSGNFMIRGEFDIMVPFTESDEFGYAIDHESKTANVYVGEFIVSRPDGDPYVLVRQQGIATMLSAEDPLFAQANTEADKLVAEQASSGAGDWFAECESSLVKQWRALGQMFGYKTSVFVADPVYPLEIRLSDSVEPMQLEDVILALEG